MNWAALASKALPYITTAVQFIAGSQTAKKNRKSQQQQNEADRQFQREMYDRQRADSVADWEKMNKYNSPQQQMQRLREAGLNPNMVYDKGADNTAVMIRSASPGTGNQPAPQYSDSLSPAMVSGLNAFSEYQKVKQSQAQTDNLNKLNGLIAADIALKQSQKEQTDAVKSGQDLKNVAYGIENNLLDLDWQQKTRLSDMYIADKTAEFNLKQQALKLGEQDYELKEVYANIALNDYELRRVLNSAQAAKTYQDILESKIQVKQKQLQYEIDTKSKETEIEKRKMELQVLQRQRANLTALNSVYWGQALNEEVKYTLIKSQIDVNFATADYTRTKEFYHGLQGLPLLFKKPTQINNNTYIKE